MIKKNTTNYFILPEKLFDSNFFVTQYKHDL